MITGASDRLLGGSLSRGRTGPLLRRRRRRRRGKSFTYVTRRRKAFVSRRVRNTQRPCRDGATRSVCEWSPGARRSDHGAAQRDAELQSAAAAHQRAEHRQRESGQVAHYIVHTTHHTPRLAALTFNTSDLSQIKYI